MANLEIQGKSIEMETKSYSSPKYWAIVNLNTEETKNSEFVKKVKIRLSGSSRSDITFSEVEEQINEYFQEEYPDMEIVEFKSIEIEERERIKQRPYDNYEY